MDLHDCFAVCSEFLLIAGVYGIIIMMYNFLLTTQSFNTGMNHSTDPLNKLSSNQTGQSIPNIMLKIFSLNCCSIRSLFKRGELAVLINEHNVNIVMGCESHIDDSFAISKVFHQTSLYFIKTEV